MDSDYYNEHIDVPYVHHYP